MSTGDLMQAKMMTDVAGGAGCGSNFSAPVMPAALARLEKRHAVIPIVPYNDHAAALAKAAESLKGPEGPAAAPKGVRMTPASTERVIHRHHIPKGVRVLESKDGSVLFKFPIYDTVRFPSRPAAGPSVCVSVQKGCSLQSPAQGCRFCSTGSAVQFDGNLAVDEIVQQAKMALLTDPELATAKRVRVVFAGMGESSYNRKNVVAAMKQLQVDFPEHAVDFVIASIGTPTQHLRQMGEQIRDAFESGELKTGTQVFLQVSLHASTDAKRNHVIPVAEVQKTTVADVLANALDFVNKLRPYVDPHLQADPDYPARSSVTLNHLMLGSQRTPNGKYFEGNTGDEDMNALVKALDAFGRENFIVRLSAYNPDLRDAHSFGVVPEERFDRWAEGLREQGVFVRRFVSQASDIRGGCGQLTGGEEPLAPGEAPKASVIDRLRARKAG